MKELLLQIAGVETEAEFYQLYPTQEAFFEAYPEAQEIIAQYQQEMMGDTSENSEEQMMGTEEEMVEQMARGGMIKRKDGSYSKRGLWDNIRANKGSGKKPTKQMLEAAKKIKAEKMMYGGNVEKYANGGDTNNFLFKNLPIAEQQDILSKMVIKGKTLPFNPRLALNTFVAPRFGEDFVGGSINPMYYDKNFSFGPYFDGYADLEGAKINNYGIRGAVNLNDRLSINTDLNPNAINAGMRLNFANGGGINNPGFKSLPKEVQENIIANMSMGGEVEDYKNGGYTVRRSNDRKGKTHVVTGPDGTKKYFGDPKLGERSKSKYGKDAFYARHAKNLKNNPYFRAYAKSTWANGGIIPEMQDLILTGDNMYNMGGMVEYPTYYPGGGMIAGPMMGYEDDEFMYAMGGGININPANKGKFTAWAKKRGMSVQEAARKVMANKEKYTADVVQMANFARNAATWKKQDGGELDVFSAFTNKVPVQTESYQGQPEQVVLPNGMIESVDARTRHENMSDDEITDVLPQGSHIQSSRNKLTADQYATLMEMFKPESAEKDIKMLEQVYKSKYGKKKNKELSPADITEYAKKAYQKTPTPNNFDTEKLVTGNKQSFVDLGITMNDLIKSGKEMATQGMAYGGMINKYQGGTQGNMGVIDEGTSPILNQNIADYFRAKGNFTTPEDWNILEKYVTINPNKNKKNRILIPSNLSLEDKLKIEQAAERYDLSNLIQGYTPGTDGRFSAGLKGEDFEQKLALTTLGQEEYNKIKNNPSKIREVAYKTLNFNPNIKVNYNNPEFYKQFRKSFENVIPEDMRPFFGNTGPMGLDYWNAIAPKAKPPVASAVVTTPEGKVVRVGNMGNYSIDGTTPVQAPARSRYYSGLLEGQLGRNLSANEAELQAYLSNTPLYQMETPDTYIRSRKNEIPIGNILYNIEKTQRNAANALANQTGDWSTLAGNIANAGASAMNQVGDTLSNLNQQNINLYNQTQGLQQNLLQNNMGIRNWNLYNKQKLTNEKRNLFGQKAVKDAEMYSNYINKLSENQQKEQQSKASLLALMGAYPETFKGGPGQEMSNRILNTYGAYNNPYIGTPLDYFLNR